MSRKILVVEDDILIGMDLTDQIEECGLTPLGPCPTVERALDVISKDGCDGAILDVNLGQETSAKVAVTLKSMNIPFVIVSGYALEQLPLEFDGAPRLPKPFRSEELIDLLT